MRIVCTSRLNRYRQQRVDEEWKAFDGENWGSQYITEEYGKDYYFQALKGKEMQALAHCYTEGGVLQIDEFIVFKKFRGTGIGSALMREVLTFAKSKKFHKVYLETDPSSPAYDFYKKMGFFEEARLARHAGDRDGVIMSKFLL